MIKTSGIKNEGFTETNKIWDILTGGGCPEEFVGGGPEDERICLGIIVD